MAVQTQPSKTSKPAPAVVAKANGKSRGEGPAKIEFIKSSGDVAARVTIDTRSVKVTAKNGQSMVFPITDISLNARDAMVADSLAKRLKQQVNNHGAKNGSDALELCTALFGDIVTGKSFTRVTPTSSGRSPGRPFDVALYMEAYAKTNEILVLSKHVYKKQVNGKIVEQPVKPLTADQLADLTAKLAAKPRKEQKSTVEDWISKNAVYKRALAEIQAKRAREAAISSDDLGELAF